MGQRPFKNRLGQRGWYDRFLAKKGMAFYLLDGRAHLGSGLKDQRKELPSLLRDSRVIWYLVNTIFDQFLQMRETIGLASKWVLPCEQGVENNA